MRIAPWSTERRWFCACACSVPLISLLFGQAMESERAAKIASLYEGQGPQGPQGALQRFFHTWSQVDGEFQIRSPQPSCFFVLCATGDQLLGLASCPSVPCHNLAVGWKRKETDLKHRPWK